MSEPIIELLFTGTHHRIYYICEGNHESFRDFAESVNATGPFAATLRRLPRVKDSKENPPEWKKLVALMTRAVHHGVSKVARNPKRCKCFSLPDRFAGDERVEVCEFKTPPYRVLFFQEESASEEPCTTLIITHVFTKKRDDTPAKELKRFAALRKQYYKWRNGLGATDAVNAVAKCKKR